MNQEFRKQVILAAIGSHDLGVLVKTQGTPTPTDYARLISNFVDAIEKFDDIHALQYERIIVENTRDGIKEAIDAGEIRKVLPVVLTFKALTQTGATSSLVINLQANFNDILKQTNGPASLKAEDAKTLLGFFDSFLPKYDEEISKLQANLAK